MNRQSIVLLFGLLLVAWSCKCSTKKGISEEDLAFSPSSYSTSSYSLPIKDTIVSLSFLGTCLGEPIDSNDKDKRISYETTVTEDVLRVFEADKKITFEGSTVPIQMEYYTVNGIVSKIRGTIKTDYVSKSLIYTYGAKYGEPTHGKVEAPRADGNSIYWDYKNQSIHIYRRCSNEWNLDARPMRKEWNFKEVIITYEDRALNHRADSINRVQAEYDSKMRPIRDSIEKAKKKAIEDSLQAIERNRLLKDAHQI